MTRTALAWALFFGLIAGCGDDDGSPPRDSGPGDSGPGDDAGPPPDDSGPGDAGPTDAGGCTRTEDCPAPMNECETAFCGGGTCQTMPLPAGTPTSMQTAGDCQVDTCDGTGGTERVADDADVPDDANECTTDACSMGVPSNTPNMGAACATGVCSAAGTCVMCNIPDDCPGTDTECAMRSCTANVCGTDFVGAGVPTSMQTAGDCRVNQCDGAGMTTSANDDTDLPDDMNDCTGDACMAGVPSHPPLAAGTMCGGAGSVSVCNGMGGCVGCVTAMDCAGTDDECGTRTCTAGVCGRMNTAAGTPLSMQTAGDCQRRECDGSGMVRSVSDDTDVPVDSNPCTGDVCTTGVPSNPALPVGTACAGGRCTDTSMCVAEVFWVIRIGTGAAPLDSSAAAVFLERRAADGALLGTIALPTAMDGANHPFVLSGNSSSEGNLSRSADTRFVTLGGYATVPGTAALDSTTSAAVNRIVARVDAAGTVNTTTLISDGYNANNIRSATSVDGTAFWTGGTGTAPSGGVRYMTLGNAGPTVQVMMTPNNMRWTHVIGSQLWAGSGSGGFTQVFQVGSGTPTMAGATATLTPGMPTMGGDPYGFVFFDLDATVAGNDTLYVADARAANTTTATLGGGVQKWTFNGTTWTLANTFNSMLMAGARGITGYLDGSQPRLIVTSDDNTATRLLAIRDDGTATPPTTLLATAPTNMVFKGVALAPVP